MVDVGDPAVVEAQRNKEELLAFARDEAFRALLRTYGGRAWAWDMLAEARIYRDDVFQGAETEMTSFNLGKRSMGLRLLAQVMAAAPDQFLVMQREAMQREEENTKGDKEETNAPD